MFDNSSYVIKFLKTVRKYNINLLICVAANMGVSEGKAIGQWFGPNTVAQVLK